MGFPVHVPQSPDIWSGYNKVVESVGTGLGNLFGQYMAKIKRRKEEEKARAQAEQAYTTETKTQGMQLANPPLNANEGRYNNLSKLVMPETEPQQMEKTTINRPNLPQNMGKGYYDTLTAAKTNERLFPPQPEEYTLSKEAARYKGDKQVAYNAGNPEQPNIGNVDPSKYDPDSVEAYKSTGLYNLLRPNQEPPKAPTTREIKVGDDVITQEWTQDGTWRDVATGPRYKPSQTNVNVNTSEPLKTALQKNAAKVVMDNYDKLKDAPQQLANLKQAKQLIPAASTFMGPFSKTKLEVTKFFRANLGVAISTDGVTNAEELKSRLFFNIMDNLKKMDAQPSQLQQQIMMDALGSLTTDPQALSKIIDAYAGAIKDRITLHNQMIDSMSKDIDWPINPKIGYEMPPEGGNIKSIPQMTDEELLKELRK